MRSCSGRNNYVKISTRASLDTHKSRQHWSTRRWRGWKKRSTENWLRSRMTYSRSRPVSRPWRPVDLRALLMVKQWSLAYRSGWRTCEPAWWHQVWRLQPRPSSLRAYRRLQQKRMRTAYLINVISYLLRFKWLWISHLSDESGRPNEGANPDLYQWSCSRWRPQKRYA